MDDTRKLLILFAGAPHDRHAGRFLRHLACSFCDVGWVAQIADPAELGIPLMTIPYSAYEPGQAPAALETVARMISNADALVVGCGEHHHGVPPALKNLLDHFADTARHKPTGIATYSISHCGGVRSAIQLRIALGELGMVTVPTTYAVPNATTTLHDDGAFADPSLSAAFQSYESDLLWWADAARRHRAETNQSGVASILSMLETSDWQTTSDEMDYYVRSNGRQTLHAGQPRS